MINFGSGEEDILEIYQNEGSIKRVMLMDEEIWPCNGGRDPYVIIYETTDGNILEPYNDGTLNIISNEYIDGHGVITCDASITSIPRWFWMYAQGSGQLKSCTFPYTVTSIGDEALPAYYGDINYGPVYSTKFNFPKNISWKGWTFAYQSYLYWQGGDYHASWYNMKGVDYIPVGCYYWATWDKSFINIGSSIKNIDNLAFADNWNQTDRNHIVPTTFRFNDGIQNIGMGAFISCPTGVTGFIICDFSRMTYKPNFNQYRMGSTDASCLAWKQRADRWIPGEYLEGDIVGASGIEAEDYIYYNVPIDPEYWEPIPDHKVYRHYQDWTTMLSIYSGSLNSYRMGYCIIPDNLFDSWINGADWKVYNAGASYKASEMDNINELKKVIYKTTDHQPVEIKAIRVEDWDSSTGPYFCIENYGERTLTNEYVPSKAQCELYISPDYEPYAMCPCIRLKWASRMTELKLPRCVDNGPDLIWFCLSTDTPITNFTLDLTDFPYVPSTDTYWYKATNPRGQYNTGNMNIFLPPTSQLTETFKIKVKSSLLNQFKGDSFWQNYASHIIS